MKKVSAALVIYDHKILLFHRDNIPTIKDPDKWSLIGGHVEEGEDFEQGLIRELQEEISITPSNYQLLENYTDYLQENVAVYVVYLTSEEAQSIKLGNEGQEVKFFSFEELEHVDLTTNLKLIYQDKKELIEKLLKEEKN